MNRTTRVTRNTTETAISLYLNLDGSGEADLGTGLGFFDHMLSQVARHGSLDLSIKAEGDLHIDEHHLVEDTGLCLGKAIREALGDKRGVARYGTSFSPMDDSLSRVVIDLSGRSYLVFEASFSRQSLNSFPCELVREFFQAVSNEGQLNLHIALLYGSNTHHQVESIFKGFGRALREAILLTGSDEIPSTKGAL